MVPHPLLILLITLQEQLPVKAATAQPFQASWAPTQTPTEQPSEEASASASEGAGDNDDDPNDTADISVVAYAAAAITGIGALVVTKRKRS